MPRSYKKIDCSKSDIKILTDLSSDATNPRLALRAKIVLGCIESQQIKDIAAELDERPNTVILWRNRFSSNGLKGLYNLPRGDSGNKYGADLKQRILEKLNTIPPDSNKRWTGKTLSTELGVPPDVIWRCLRKEKIRLADIDILSDNDTHETEEIYDIPLKLSVRKDNSMANDKNNIESVSTGDGSMDLVITAKIVGKDGTVIEKEIRLNDALPNVTDFDLSTKEGFLRDFDKLEKSMLTARGQITEDITKEYLDVASKKKESSKTQ